ncbi:hypothetical protein BLOT_015128, partial [Blomia tropicalis]
LLPFPLILEFSQNILLSVLIAFSFFVLCKIKKKKNVGVSEIFEKHKAKSVLVPIRRKLWINA